MGGIWVAVVAGWAVVFGLVVWAVCRLFPAQCSRDAQHNGRSHGGRARALESHEHIG